LTPFGQGNALRYGGAGGVRELRVRSGPVWARGLNNAETLSPGWCNSLRGAGRARETAHGCAPVKRGGWFDTSVGYGGLPNDEGEIELDASVMNGLTYRCGAAGGAQIHQTPSRVARLVMECTDHMFLVGWRRVALCPADGFQERRPSDRRVPQEMAGVEGKTSIN